MTTVHVFTFNPFEENTLVVYDDSGECIIIDPGCYTLQEQQKLESFIRDKALRPVRLLSTHCHVDHVFGNAFVANRWGLLPECHEEELPLLKAYPEICRMYGIPDAVPSPMPEAYLTPGQTLRFGQTELDLLYTPGHSPASISLYCREGGFLIAGDVLFYESIGRTDLPGGDHQTLLDSIRNELFVLPPATLVYPGHGPTTTIRHEMEYNPFL